MSALRERVRAVPDRRALKSAARTAIVMPAVFAFADAVIGWPQTTIFAAFGSFAVLVPANFDGPPRARLAAYLGLAGAGAVLIPLGTLSSQGALLGASAMAVVGFAILFSGVVNAYVAAALGDALVRAAAPPPPDGPDPEARVAVLGRVRDAVSRGDEARIRAAVGVLLASRNLDNLRRLEGQLHEPAARVSGYEAVTSRAKVSKTST